MKTSESPGASLLVERQMLLSRVRSQIERRKSVVEPVSRYRFVTITRDVGALGDDIGRTLADELQWHLYDREIVNFIAQDVHVREGLVRDLDEKSQSLIHDTVQRLLLTAEGISFGNQEYHESLLKTLAVIATHGEAVIVGRGGVYALQEESGLHIRIFASSEVRVRRLAERWCTGLEDARRRMEKIDAERRNFRMHHFRKNVEDLDFFDAVFNTDDLSVSQVVHSITRMLAAPVPRSAHPPDRLTVSSLHDESVERK